MGGDEKAEPRARILEVADRLFYANGVRATGTEKIMSASEVAKATFYRHFESKDALVLAYLEQRDLRFWEYLFRPSPPGDLFEALGRMESLINRPETIGCPFLRVASEYPDMAHPFHRRAVEHQDKMLAYFSDLVDAFDVNREKAAQELLALFDGALSLRMVYGGRRAVSLGPSARGIVGSPKMRDRAAGSQD